MTIIYPVNLAVEVAYSRAQRNRRLLRLLADVGDHKDVHAGKSGSIKVPPAIVEPDARDAFIAYETVLKFALPPQELYVGANISVQDVATDEYESTRERLEAIIEAVELAHPNKDITGVFTPFATQADFDAAVGEFINPDQIVRGADAYAIGRLKDDHITYVPVASFKIKVP